MGDQESKEWKGFELTWMSDEKLRTTIPSSLKLSNPAKSTDLLREARRLALTSPFTLRLIWTDECQI